MIDSNTVTDSTCGDDYLDNNDTTDQSSVPAKKSGIFGASSNLVNSIVYDNNNLWNVIVERKSKFVQSSLSNQERTGQIGNQY